MTKQSTDNGFTLNRQLFADILVRTTDGEDSESLGLDSFLDSQSKAIGGLVALAQVGGAIQVPEDLADLDLEVVVYDHDDEYSSNLMVALRPSIGAVSRGVRDLWYAGQVASLLNDASDYGPRDDDGARERGIAALTATVEDVLIDASSLLGLVRAIVRGSAVDNEVSFVSSGELDDGKTDNGCFAPGNEGPDLCADGMCRSGCMHAD